LDQLPIVMKSALTYGSVNPGIMSRVPNGCRRILDVGCGTGVLGSALKAGHPERLVVGITHSELEAEQAREVLDQVVIADLETSDFRDLGEFDCVICSHVLEHLRNPTDVLARLRAVLAADGMVLIALPNVLHWRQRLQFLMGRFRYTQGGLMDDTHVVFFDWVTARSLVDRAGFRLTACASEGGFPGSRFLGTVGDVLDAVSLRLAPGLMGTQFVLVARG
jgi:SAM-dependent methyltransferase